MMKKENVNRVVRFVVDIFKWNSMIWDIWMYILNIYAESDIIAAIQKLRGGSLTGLDRRPVHCDGSAEEENVMMWWDFTTSSSFFIHAFDFNVNKKLPIVSTKFQLWFIFYNYLLLYLTYTENFSIFCIKFSTT